MAPTRFAMLSPENQFSFDCPIFKVEVKMRQCNKLVEVTKVNQKLEVRKGCQACIRSGKCPADVMSRMISFGAPGIAPEDYGAATPTKGKLGQHILKRIAPVMINERWLNELGVPDAERQLIASSHEGLMKAMPSLTDERAPSASTKRKRAAKAEPAKPAASDRVNKAAETGDMAAAL